jgi:uncharacterized protein YbjT (DUF2867 family)
LRILLLGASGFIGSAVGVRLAAEDHEIIAVSRSKPSGAERRITHVRFDIAAAAKPEQWQPLLDNVHAVINCAGTLQDAAGESTRGVHETGIAALVRACEVAGVRRLVHLSAIGVDRERPTAFSQSKWNGDRAIMASTLDWVILRPSVVVGRGAYGGSALLRGLAALPMFPMLPGSGALQLVHLDDLVETIAFFIRPDAPARCTLEIAGPRAWPFADAVALFRCWLRWPPAYRISAPAFLASTLYKSGDLAGLLGWRTPIRSTAQREIRRGAVGDPAEWTRLTGIVPRDIEMWMHREPASVQERWFARLYLLKPLIIAGFGLYWIATGIISFTAGWPHGLALLQQARVGTGFAALVVAAGAAADIVIGCAILYRPWARYGLYAALFLSAAYVVIATVMLPALWSDPLGPLLKIVPIVLLNLAALAILPER